jgi:hypothetical protein
MGRYLKKVTDKVDLSKFKTKDGKTPTVEDVVEGMALIGSTNEEIGAILGLDPETVAQRFSDRIKKGKMTGFQSLRRTMFEKAINERDTTSLIWLSKNYLKMKDTVEHSFSDKEESAVTALLNEFRSLVKK